MTPPPIDRGPNDRGDRGPADRGLGDRERRERVLRLVPPDIASSNETWVEYRRLVLGELERLGERIETVATRCDVSAGQLATRIDALQATQIGDLRAEIAALKAKSGIWGAMTGALTALAVAIGSVLLRR